STQSHPLSLTTLFRSRATLTAVASSPATNDPMIAAARISRLRRESRLGVAIARSYQPRFGAYRTTVNEIRRAFERLPAVPRAPRSEEHTSELQSRRDL